MRQLHLEVLLGFWTQPSTHIQSSWKAVISLQPSSCLTAAQDFGTLKSNFGLSQFGMSMWEGWINLLVKRDIQYWRIVLLLPHGIFAPFEKRKRKIATISNGEVLQTLPSPSLDYSFWGKATDLVRPQIQSLLSTTYFIPSSQYTHKWKDLDWFTEI